MLSPTAAWPASYAASTTKPPDMTREFRGIWVASVNNIDWPSRRDLTSAQQQAELLALLDLCVQMRCNAVLLQVRPACDALYNSKLEPWSEYLTGTMGEAPKPFYDPLEFAVAEAHRRGLELHAWFNPFRARHNTGNSPLAKAHISRTQPDLVRSYGGQLWLDPGLPDAREYSLKVMLDVVRRYDVDAVHLDDYFYPYPIRDSKGNEVDFPDDASWKKYQAKGGKLSRGDWRRANVDTFVEQLYRAIKAEKPWVKLGISPFGIWRPGYPAGIRGFDAYAQLYADSRAWLKAGWLDYFTPQLYWAIGAEQQSFTALLNWWHGQNTRQRHLWPGSSIYRHNPAEITAQIQATRKQAGASGNVLWSAKVIRDNRNGMADRLRADCYAQPALVPASPWLDSRLPGTPDLTATVQSGAAKLNWRAVDLRDVRFWLLQTKSNGRWNARLLDRTEGSATLATPPEMIALSAVDRCGNVSKAAVMEMAR